MQRLTSVAFGLSLLAACGTSSDDASTTSAVTRAQYDDTAQIVAATTTSSTNGDVSSMSDSISIALGVLPSGISLSGNGHYQGKRLGADFNYDVACSDLHGNPLPACGPLTDKASVDVSLSGSLSTPLLSASLMRTGSWMLSGLQTTTATFNGNGNVSFDAANYKFDSNNDYSDVILATTNREPMAGTASFDVHASQSATDKFDIHVDVAFNADETATIVLDGDQDYLLNMQNGLVARTN